MYNIGFRAKSIHPVPAFIPPQGVLTPYIIDILITIDVIKEVISGGLLFRQTISAVLREQYELNNAFYLSQFITFYG